MNDRNDEQDYTPIEVRPYQRVSKKFIPMPEEADEQWARNAADAVVDALINDLRSIGGSLLMREVLTSEVHESIRASVLEACRDGYQQGWLAHCEKAYTAHTERAGSMFAAIFEAAGRGASKEEIVTTGLLTQTGASPDEAKQLYKDLTTQKE